MSTNDDLDAEIVQEFLIESHENLDQLDRDLVALEQQPGSRDLLASIFRTIHTIKGTSGFLAYTKLEAVTHAGESLLAKLRDGAFQLTPDTASALLRMVDLVRVILGNIEQAGSEGDTEVAPLVEELRAILEAKLAEAAGGAPASAPAVVSPAEPITTPAVEAVVAAAAPVKAAAKTPAKRAPRAPRAKAAAAVPTTAAVPTIEVPAVITLPTVDTESDEAPAAPRTGGEAEVSRTNIGDSTIRVDVDLLEQLVRLVGELVLARNQIVQRASTINDEDLSRACHRLNLVAGELQEGVMRTRMQPIDHIWSKLPRVVRDLGSQLNRSVRLDMEGGDIELDRSLLEAVKDPLTHLVRNAIDHGIEPPEVRKAIGKPETGVLRLRAAHEGGQVLVEIRDDGKGLDPAVLGQHAVNKGLISASALEGMSPADILQLVFVPGFSTASSVTNVSGRGVGMDVVRTNIQRIGGSIDVDSTVGRGTAWHLRIPLTLAIVPALTVACAGQRFAIPQVNLLELVSLDGGRSGAGVENVAGAEVYRLRGSLLPLVRLDEALGLRKRSERGHDSLVVAVLEADGRRFGLVVDRVLDTEEIVVKPLSSALKELGLYAGATILGDGAVSLILDVQSLARRLLRSMDSHEEAGMALAQAATKTRAERQLLVVALGGDRRVAIPLDVVTRLEQFPASSIERVGRRDVVRYRGAIMPLVRLSEHLGGYEEERETIPGVVYSARGRSVALAVGEIVDIVSESAVVDSDVEDMGLIGSAVIRDRVTEMLDVRAAILAADPNFYVNEPALSAGSTDHDLSYDSLIGVN